MNALEQFEVLVTMAEKTRAEALAEVKAAVQEAIDDWDAGPDSAWMVYDRIAARLDPNYRQRPDEEGEG